MKAEASSIGIAGAGSIGCFVGGCLAAGGRRVAMLMRPRIIEEIEANGLRLSSYDGMDLTIPAAELRLSQDPAVLAGANIIIVTVKGHDTAEMADHIRNHARPEAIIVSLQNGVDNLPLLRAKLPDHQVLGGMVPFNVLARGAARFHRATSGDIVLENGPRDFAAELSVPNLAMQTTANIDGVLWGKLLINLNNALNALAGVPLREQLAKREWRLLLADQMAEALKIFGAAGIRPVPMTPLPPWVTPWLLRLPDGLFHLMLGRVMQIDADARSSMWDDLQRRRPTEVDLLQGAVVRLAHQAGRAAPLSERIVDLVHAAEARGEGSPYLAPAAIRGAIGA